MNKYHAEKNGTFIHGLWDDGIDVSDVLDLWQAKGYDIFCNGKPIMGASGYELTPPTGFDGSVYRVAIRTTGTHLHVCEVKGATEEQVTLKAKQLIKFLEIARKTLKQEGI